MKHYTIYLLFLFLLLLTSKVDAKDVVYQHQDSLIFEKYASLYFSHQEESMADLLIETALFLRNKPYVANTLEQNTEECLTVNLQQFDCMTFVENAIALAKVIRSGDTSFENYCEILKGIRYRDGEIDGYSSRLHYVTDWIYQNQEDGILRNVTLDLGGKMIQKRLDIMTTRAQSYNALSDTVELIRMKDVETRMNERNDYSLIPVSKISKIEKHLKNGDIVIFGTNLKGLDYSHIGIVYHSDMGVQFIHASSSSSKRKVVIEPRTISQYCTQSTKCTGISVLRLN